jgi:hypothetical protein
MLSVPERAPDDNDAIPRADLGACGERAVLHGGDFVQNPQATMDHAAQL